MADTGLDMCASASGAAPFFLLGCFADFYEEIASIRTALEAGTMPFVPTPGDEPAPRRGIELASRIGDRLEAVLRQQAATVRRRGTADEIKMHSLAQYVMAAVADEIFIFELGWPEREVWLEVMLESRLFRTRNAGDRLFRLADQLLETLQRGPLFADAAAVLLLALRLGFKGRYRGAAGEAALRAYRHRLYELSGAGNLGEAERRRPAFEQAYQHRLSGDHDARRAPLSRWRRVAQMALAAYLAASTLVWMAATAPLAQAVGRLG